MRGVEGDVWRKVIVEAVEVVDDDSGSGDER